MDAIDFFLVRYEQIHHVLRDPAIKQLTAAQMRGRPHPGVNTIVWLLWHMARVEDVGVNRFVADRPQVLDDGWLARLGITRRDVGTGMNDAEVDDLSARIDLDALRGYGDVVTRRTLDVVAGLRGSELEALVPGERVEQVARRADRRVSSSALRTAFPLVAQEVLDLSHQLFRVEFLAR